MLKEVNSMTWHWWIKCPQKSTVSGLIIVFVCVYTKAIRSELLVFRFGTERLYAQKEDLLHEVLELEAEKNLLASGESKYQDDELRKRALEELTSPEPDKSTVLSVTTAPPTGKES